MAIKVTVPVLSVSRTYSGSTQEDCEVIITENDTLVFSAVHQVP